VTWFHGGVTGLAVGDSILPPTETGAVSVSDLDHSDKAMQAQVERVHRKDRVYVTSDVRAAAMFAALHEGHCCHLGGSVYEVEPVGEIEPDLDCLDDDLSAQAPRARVVAILTRAVPRERVLAAFGVEL
jgi:rifampin ADP-ribosylating transferase